MLANGPDSPLAPDRPARRNRFLCPTCEAVVDPRSRHVVVKGSSVRIFCSAECKEGARVQGLLVLEATPPRRTWRHAAMAAGGALAIGGTLAGLVTFLDHRTELGLAHFDPQAMRPAVVEEREEPAAVEYGPSWPPTEAEWIEVLARDAWIHPLGGPERRMPIRDSRVFGADRPGMRPAECVSGHCGVDLGQSWGEPVFAVQGGEVVRVQRNPNTGSGLYVRVAHRDGTIFSQYLHLAAIPKWIAVGREVRMGDVLGLLGDTGVKSSGPHLHFTLSVKPSADLPERYIDPEPLIALWPLKVPLGCSAESIVSTSEPPGMVRGAAPPRRRASRRPPPAAADAAPAGEAVETIPEAAKLLDL